MLDIPTKGVARYTYVHNQKQGYGVYVGGNHLGDVYKRRNRSWTVSQFIKIPKKHYKKATIHGFTTRKSAADYLHEIAKIEDTWCSNEYR